MSKLALYLHSSHGVRAALKRRRLSYLRGRPVGHPDKPSDTVIMTTQVSAYDGVTAVTGETTWALGEAASTYL